MGACSTGYPLALVVVIAAAAALSGGLFGWSWREAREGVLDALRRRTPPPRSRQGGGAPPRRARRDRSGYFLSEDTRTWGDRRWIRRAGWVLTSLIACAVIGSLVIAGTSYRSAPQPSADIRRP